MNKQYMDFVPTGSQKAVKKSVPGANTGAVRAGAARPVKTGVVAPKPGTTKAVRTNTAKVARPAMPRGVVQSSGTVAFSTEKKATLGKVENLTPKFVKTDVPKRPLSEKSHFKTDKTGLARLKAKRIGNTKKAAIKPVENSAKKAEKGTFKTPKQPFINQDKVVKRPLSKNVYQKKIAAPKEEPKGPVTIITKPEKQAHIGMIVTIILTIILGAAAGTVAFLLLPK